jgi:serine/threonine-protein kinase
MGRHPVTVSEYREFISALAASGRLEEALRRVPRESSETGAYWHVDAGGEVTLADPAADNEFVWSDRLPVSCVSWEDAIAYCEWLSERLGTVVSLPHDEDWEKAARGADGRFFPWGNHHDYTFANNAHSHEGGGRLVPVGTFPMDRSPYGVCDMAGNVRELCRNSPAPNYPHAAVIRGGGYNSPSLDVRNAGRAMVLKKDVRKLIGFRVAIYPEGIPAGEEATPADAPPVTPEQPHRPERPGSPRH